MTEDLNLYCPMCDFCHGIDKRMDRLEEEVRELRQAVFLKPARKSGDLIIAEG